MRITRLEIEGYKNIDIKLVHQSDIIALDGKNGCGKSNLLEALSYIFRSLYDKNEKVDFKYLIEYKNSDNKTILIEKKQTKPTFKVDNQRQVSIDKFLPKKIVTIYSGEEDRLWKNIYFPLYNDFVSKINKSGAQGLQMSQTMPQMLYLNKFYWHLSLLSLLLSDSPDNLKFVKEVLKIKKVDKIKIDFLSENYENYSSSLIMDFIRAIDHKNEYTLEELKQLLNEKGFIPDDVYKYLYFAFTPKDKKIVNDITILFNENLQIEDLSEGEKKLLLIKSAFEFAEQEDSLFILDEPDAHVHLNNKPEIIKTFEPYKTNRQIILTTHSPTVSHALNPDNLYMIDDGKQINKKKQEVLKALTGEYWNIQQQNIFLSSDKPIILFVEGKHDKLHIQKAFEVLKDDYPTLDFDIFNMDGADNIPQILTGLRTNDLSYNTLFIGIFDNDKEGRNCSNQSKVRCIDGNNKLNENLIKKGYVSFCYPKPVDYTNENLTIENLYDATKYQLAYQEALKNYSFGNKHIDESSNELKKNAKDQLSLMISSFAKNDFNYFRKFFNLILEIWNIYISKQKKQIEIDNTISSKEKKEILQKQKDFVENNQTDAKLPAAIEEAKSQLNRNENYKILFLTGKGANAKLRYYSDNSLVLLKDSTVVKEHTTSCLVSTIKLRTEAIENNLLKDYGEYYLLTKDIHFKAPSPAASFVLGRNSNGNNEWKDATGSTFKELFRKR